MDRISGFTSFPLSLTQCNPTHGCIPANIVAVLTSYGLGGVTETNLIRAYLSTMSFKSVKEELVLSKFRSGTQLLSEIVELDVAESEDFLDWWNKLTNSIRIHKSPVLFSFRVNGDSHICTAIGCDNDTLETFDPSPHEPRRVIPRKREELQNMWGGGRLNHDMMSIRIGSSNRPSGDVLRRSYDAQLKKMLGLIALWVSLFLALVGVFSTIGNPASHQLELGVRWLIRGLAVVLGITGGFVATSVLAKFGELVFLEKQQEIDLVSFYEYLRVNKIPSLGARIWDKLVRSGILGIKDRREEYNYSRIGRGLDFIVLAVWALLVLLCYSIWVMT